MLLDGRKPRGILVRPDPSHARDIGFLEAVANAAKQSGIPIYFEGSLLGHAYYVMAGTGASVIPVGAVPKSKPTVYDKLVRDRIPAIVQETGGVARVRTLDRSEARLLLAQKLVEEAFEVWNAQPPEMASELADVLEVVQSLANAAGLASTEIDDVRQAKRRDRGGFEGLVYLEETAVRPLELDALEVSPLEWSASSRSRARYRDPVTITRDADSGRAVIRIPTVPPTRSGLPIRTHRAVLGDLEVEFRFAGATVEIVLGAPNAPPAGDQLSFGLDT
jgi:predicted house-cleaning noncanonical NTP pyrophosphatase (MazG superfamily)